MNLTTPYALTAVPFDVKSGHQYAAYNLCTSYDLQQRFYCNIGHSCNHLTKVVIHHHVSRDACLPSIHIVCPNEKDTCCVLQGCCK